jgi:valyl-tRNA synthetase
MDRFEAREAIINDLKELGLLLKVEKHKLSIGYCHRCGTIIEPYLSTQWFVKMKELARPAIRAVEDGEIRFFPQRWKGVYLSWMSNIKDWCISRQLWWGHRIPVWYCKKQQNEKCKRKNGVIVSRTKPEKCPYCGSTDLVQDPDVLDTWFSSWLWPFSTFGWPGNTDDIKFFYPTNFLTTGGEIIFFWVARMIVAGYEFMGNKPFSTVYIHGTVRDRNGIRMQKSLGNGIDPLLIINKYGTDALRFSLIAAAGEGQDPHIQENSFEVGRNFCNKIWNSYRLIERLKREERREKREGLNLADRWIESRLNYMIMRVTNSLSNYRLNDACMTIYEFFWHEFCDWWLELTKETRNIELAYSILEKTLRILHPFMPFITEEVWQRIPHKGESIMVAEWPMPESLDEKAESDMEVIQNVTRAVRNMKSSHNIPLSRDVTIYIRTDKAKRKIIEENHRYIERLAFVNRMDFESQIPKESALEVIQTIGVFLPLSGLIDVEKEKERLEKEIAILEALLIKTQTKLSNPDFLSKAKKEVVKNTEKKRKEYEEKLNKLKQDISPIS